MPCGESGGKGWLFQQSQIALLLFERFDLALDNLTNEGGPSLLAHEGIDTLAHSFRQTDDGRFHFERRPSHSAEVNCPPVRAIITRINDIGY